MPPETATVLATSSAASRPSHSQVTRSSGYTSAGVAAANTGSFAGTP